MKIRGFVTFSLFFFACGVTLAQNENSKSPSSIDPNSTKVYSPKASKKKKSASTTYDARDKFYDRMEMVNKKRRKNENMESKPQYSNFQYFGHKKPPRKRSPEKMKYCRICGIRH
jgi:hypothetical protein